MSQIKKALILRKYEEAGSLHKLVLDVISEASGKFPRVAMDGLTELLLVSEKARKEIANAYVLNIHKKLQAAAAERRAIVEAKAKKLQALVAEKEQEKEKEKAQAEYVLQFRAEKDAAAAMKVVETKKFSTFDKISDAIRKCTDEEFAPLLSPADAKAMVLNVIKENVLDQLEDKDWEVVDHIITYSSDTRKNAKAAEAVRRAVELIEEKAKSFDRMVLALDAITVGGKVLGDCTGSDLLREAVKLEEATKQMTTQSVFYRSLAEIVGKTTTVRAASERGQVIALLNTTYKDAA